MRRIVSAPNVQEHEELLTVEQLSERTGFTEQFLRRAKRRSNLPFYKLGKFVRFRMSEFEAWLKERRHAG